MNKLKFAILLIIVGGMLGLGVSLLSAEIIKNTNDAAFCGSCHSMKPMADTFKLDVHGGKNEHGFVAECADCHLPKDNIVNYMVKKTSHGINDVFKEVFTDTDKIDWISLRNERERFVYDSGCLSCHQNLLNKTEADNPRSLELHAKYNQTQQGDEPLNCVSCHVTVGHNGMLRSELNKYYPEYTFK
ncbi:cytochrome C [Photobacterium sanctipauli]|uniref:Cytochrome c-type protein n=1 Tax=Photobacterium sanctipauli TaxID=1342794 RepID=A0A2T3NP66_9GAMM|nr:NapC/NirT family cytochrome c [Photobacterium sanctipauli]PSW18065.1 cytochrome C [Photobacterium sanctipauli]